MLCRFTTSKMPESNPQTQSTAQFSQTLALLLLLVTSSFVEVNLAFRAEAESSSALRAYSQALVKL